jgi:plastocyanin
MLATERPASEVRTTGWTRLVLAAVAIDLAVVLAVGVTQREKEALFLAVVLGAGLGLLRWRHRRAVRGGRALAALIFVDVEFWMLPAALSGVTNHDAVVAVSASLALALASLVGLIGLAGQVIGTRAGQMPRVVGVAAAIVFAVALVGASAVGPHAGQSRPGELTIRVRDTRYSTTRLEASGGQISVRMTNDDLFWHTFTIAGRGVDLKVPLGASRRATFELPAGVYEFYCRVPGHRQGGMHGSLVVH